MEGLTLCTDFVNKFAVVFKNHSTSTSHCKWAADTIFYENTDEILRCLETSYLKSLLFS